MITKDQISQWYQDLQDQICRDLEFLDGTSKFIEDKWSREEGGGGRSRVLTGGDLIEKGGVNYSAVEGPTPKKIADALGLSNLDFYATGVSIVLHPKNPWVPIIHMNVRYFEMSNGQYWFGGGIDLTPHYIDKSSGFHIHNVLKSVCDKTDSKYYSKFKIWADDYFFIKHRNETRGVGGIFFDRLSENSENKTKNELWNFSQSVGNSFIEIYSHYANNNRHLAFDKENIKWQHLRRGRYVEFNLVWDKGTKFGLDTGGRTESILMSLPPDVSWEYDQKTKPNSPEAETLKWLKKDIDWINNDR